MVERLTPRRIVALIMIVIGLLLYLNAQEVKTTAEDTVSYMMSPATKVLDNPDSLSSFDADTYLNTSISKTMGLSIDIIKFAGAAEAGVGAIFVGLILLFIRTMEWEKEFYKKVVSFFIS